MPNHTPAQQAIAALTTKAERVAAREALGLTQLQLAVECGTSPQVIRQWELGSIPRADFAEKYAAALGLDPELPAPANRGTEPSDRTPGQAPEQTGGPGHMIDETHVVDAGVAGRPTPPDLPAPASGRTEPSAPTPGQALDPTGGPGQPAHGTQSGHAGVAGRPTPHDLPAPATQPTEPMRSTPGRAPIDPAEVLTPEDLMTEHDMEKAINAAYVRVDADPADLL